MHVHKASCNGNPNIGLYGLETDNTILLGKEFPEKDDKVVKEVFGKDVARITIAGTSLIGVFCVWHQGKLLIPGITFDDELRKLEELKIPYEVIATELTCLGNNILATEKAAIINPDFTEKEAARLSEALGVPCERKEVNEIEAVGSIGVVRHDKGLFHRDLRPETVKELEEKLGITITQGTVNMGSPYIKSGILIGEKGFLVGDTSGGPEIRNADEALGFIEG